MEEKILSVRERALLEEPARMALHDSLTWDKIYLLEAECGVLNMLAPEDIEELSERLLVSREKFPQAIARYIRLGMAAELAKQRSSVEPPAR